jgi:hypothetical protein
MKLKHTSNKKKIQSNKEIQSISAYTILGEKLRVFNSHQKEINISHLPKGIYLLRIQFKNQGTIIRKIIKY